MISIVTLMAGRFYSLEAYFWGLQIIDYPKDQIHLLFLTNSDNDDFIHLIERRIESLKGYASARFVKTDMVRPSSNAFIENGVHTNQHAETIATLYNEAYKYIETEDFLFLEDDIIAPSNALSGLLTCFKDDVGYVCGTQMNRHGGVNATLFMWDLVYKRVYPEGDSCNEKTHQAVDIRKPWGIREIGLGHFGLTLLKKSICDKIPKPTFKPSLPQYGSLQGCDMIMCLELNALGYKKICNFDVRACHMDSLGRIH